MLVYDNFELLYEGICRRNGGLAALVKMCCRFLVSLVSPCAGVGTVLVNASAVGGLRDTVRRDAVVVHL